MPQVPLTGYSVPYLPQPGFDPLISPDAAGWWRRSIAIVRAGWTQLAAIQAIGAAVQVVVQVPLMLYVASRRDQLIPTVQSDGATAGSPDVTGLFAFLGLSLIVAFAAIVIGAVVTIATIQVGVAIAAGGQPRLGPALLAALRRAFPLLGWQMLAGLVMAAGLCACVLPIFYLLAVFTILPAVVTFERTNAISRCFRLFHGSLGPAVGRIAAILGIGIGAAVVSSILSGIVGAAAGASAGLAPTAASNGASVAATVVSVLISAVIARGTGVLTGPLTLTAYADLRARIEPLTTQTLLAELGTPTTT
jgi:hypothetical protein